MVHWLFIIEILYISSGPFIRYLGTKCTTNQFIFLGIQADYFCHSKIHACALDRHNQITNIYKNLIIPNLFPPLVATNWLLARHWLQIGVKLSHSLRWDGKTERSWCEISTFPKHSHEQTSVRVKEGDLSALWRYWKSVYHESRLEVSVFYRMLLMLQQYETFAFKQIVCSLMWDVLYIIVVLRLHHFF